MGSDWELWIPLNRTIINHVLIKVFVCALLAGVSFRLFFCRSIDVVPPSAMDGDPMTRTDSDAPVYDIAPNTEEVPAQESCDIFTGQWVPSPVGPAYTNVSCRFIDDHQNCMMNGRPDAAYLFWRWKPDGCDLPPFDPFSFLNSMRNKAWALIGDSILRNQIQSFICLLSKAEEPVELYHSADFRTRKWHFPSHNLSLSLLWSPFLVQAETFENEDGISDSEIQLHLDTPDSNWTLQYQSFDYVIISSGQWFLKTAIYWQNNTIIGCHNCLEKNYTELGFEFAYRKTLEFVFGFITSSDHKPIVIFRTWTPEHFENGQWFNGGTCNRTKPYKVGEYKGKYLDHIMREIELQEFEKAKLVMDGLGRSNYLRLMDSYDMMVMRPDGHAGAYRMFHPFDKGKNVKVQNDCLHWCVPGPIDAWNDLIMEMVVK